MATVHSSTRAYAYSCTYSSATWIDNSTTVDTLISDIQTELALISNFSYLRLIYSSMRNSSGTTIEIEIDGITYNSKTKLNATENDDLILDLEGAFDSVSNFTYSHVDIVNDVFREDQTTGWGGDSFEKE